MTIAEEFAAEIAKGFPRLARKTIDRLAEMHAETMSAAVDGITSVEVVGAHIAVDFVAYPNGATVGIDAAGNLVDVNFSEPVIVE